eukprot:scpid95096/ scgid25010/ 
MYTLPQQLHQDPLLTRMPGPVQEVYCRLDLASAFFSCVFERSTKGYLTVPQSVTPSAFRLSRDCVHGRTTFWVRGRRYQSGLVTDKDLIMHTLFLLGYPDLDRRHSNEVYWTMDDLLCVCFAAQCRMPGGFAGTVRFAILFEIAPVHVDHLLKTAHISIDSRDFEVPSRMPTFGLAQRGVPLSLDTDFYAMYFDNIQRVFGLYRCTIDDRDAEDSRVTAFKEHFREH